MLCCNAASAIAFQCDITVSTPLTQFISDAILLNVCAVVLLN